MGEMLQFGLLSLFLILSGIGAVVGAFQFDSVGTIIVLIVMAVLLILGGLYYLNFALAYKFGKKVTARITKKEYIPEDNNEHVGNSYYRYEYEIVSNGKVKKGHFRIYYLDQDIISVLNIGDEIEARKLLLVSVVDSYQVIDSIREKHKDNPDYQRALDEQKKYNRKTFKKEILIGVCLLALIAICCLIYVLA